MIGSQIIQQIYLHYVQTAQDAMREIMGPILIAVTGVVSFGIAMNIILVGSKLMIGSMDMGDVTRRVVTAVIIAALTAQATFNQYVGQMLTVTIPDLVTQTVMGGATADQVTQVYDGIVNYVHSQGAQLRAQMVGWSPIWIGYIVAEWVIETAEEAFNTLSFLIFAAARIESFVIVPVVAMTLWAFLFHATRPLAERTLMVCAGLIVVQALALNVANFSGRAVSAVLRDWSHAVPLAGSNNNFVMQSGDIQFTGFGNPDVPGGGGQPVGPVGGAINSATIGVARSLGLMIDGLLAILFGFGLLLATVITTAVICATSGGLMARQVVNTVQKMAATANAVLRKAMR